MSIRGQQPRNRRARRQQNVGTAQVRPAAMDLPGPLRFLSNPKLFMIFAAFAGIAMVVGLAAGALSSGTTTDSGPMQANEAPDVPINSTTQTPDTTSDAAPVQRFTEPPAMAVDTSKTYKATVQTAKGAITIELYPSKAPEAVNAFVFLAQQGYYNGTPFMELVKDQSGGKFYAQAGDPTRTGLGTPGFSIKKEQTDLPFGRGYVGMGGSASNSNGGQFFISYGDYPALTGKYTIFGKVVSGLDVLDNLTLLDLTSGRASGTGDTIQSVTIGE
jgi:cyclophilin family peptidyl-prolyl cis-trans isomerase